jgi:hypothetical protein
MRIDQQKPSYLLPDNLIELSCRDCTKEARRDDPSVVRVLHLFDFAGDFARSEIEHHRADTQGEDRTRKVQQA